MDRDSMVFYRSFYEALKELNTEQQGQVYNAIFTYQFEGKDCELDGIPKAMFALIRPQIDANNKKYINGCKGGRPKNLNGTKTKPKVIENGNQNGTEIKPNDNENENENENVEGVMGDSCGDGPEQLASRVDEVVNFFENNIGMITPHEFDVLDSYRQDFSDDIIIYALQLQVEKRATGVSYAKAILNNWKKKNIKTLLEAKNENGKMAETKTTNTYHAEDDQYTDLSKFYMN